MTKKISIKSPLRYPGGKARLVKQILAMAPEDYREYREPFLGGGSVLFGVHEAKPDIDKKVGDSFEPLYQFWRSMKDTPEDVVSNIDYIRKHYKEKKLWEHCREKVVSDVRDDSYKAACYFILNRITFSGLTLSGGYSQASYETRFNETHISRLKETSKVLKTVEVFHEDYTHLLSIAGSNVWIYLDPPYDIKSDNLYGSAGASHKGFDHIKFADDCKSCNHKWLITYNDNEKIRDLYSSWANVVEVPVKYSMNSTAKVTQELFITNY